MQLDHHVSKTEPRTSTIAAQDQLFLTYNAKAVTRFKGVDELRHIYDLTSLLLAKLPSFSTSVSRQYWSLKSSAPASSSLDDEKSIANLDHILRCLRQAALEALIYHGLRSFEEGFQQWHQHWLQQRQLDFGWFSEWPNGRRPLSTTWPWNIKPSLVVLWGVCWMFYDNSTRSAQELRQQLENEEVATSVWARHTPQSATSSQRKSLRNSQRVRLTESDATESITNWATGNSDSSFQHAAWLQTGGQGGVNARQANRESYPLREVT